MTTKEMTIPEHAQTARDFLAASDREFVAGDHLQGSEKLYGAATQAVIAICQQRGWRYKSHRAMKQAVTELARESGDDAIAVAISGGFIAAENFHRNFFHDHMEDYEREADRPTVHHFVNRLLGLLEGGNGSGP